MTPLVSASTADKEATHHLIANVSSTSATCYAMYMNAKKYCKNARNIPASLLPNANFSEFEHILRVTFL